MPSLADRVSLEVRILKKTSKLLDCQKEMMHYWHDKGLSQRQIAKLFNCSRRTVQFELFPEKHKQNMERRAERGGSKQYYNKEKYKIAMRNHRKYKHELLIEKK